MTQISVAEMIESIGLPYAYYQFDEDTAQAPPFVVFFFFNVKRLVCRSDKLSADRQSVNRILFVGSRL